MIVTIIGSLSRKEDMLKAKTYFESFGCLVNCPCDEYGESLALIEKQSCWITAIEEADLIVVIAKYKSIDGAAAEKTKYILEFGESTSYEIAIAERFKKRFVFW